MDKELIARLRVGAGIERERVLYIGWSPLANEAADAIEALQATATEYQQAADKMAMEHKIERDTLRQHIKHIGNDALRSENHELRQQLAASLKDALRYRWLRDNSASISWNPSRFNSEIVSGFSHNGTGYLGFNFEDAINAAMGGANE